MSRTTGRGASSETHLRELPYALLLLVTCGIAGGIMFSSIGNSHPAPDGAALHDAARAGDVAAVERELSRGADVDRGEVGSGLTPLMWAARAGRAEVVKRLIERGADVDAADRAFGTPLANAASFGHADVMRDLLAAGADPDAAPASGYTPLFAAACMGEAVATGVLVEAGADVDAPSYVGTTPLMAAAGGGFDAVVRRLIDAGADLDARDDAGSNAADEADRVGHASTARLLREARLSRQRSLPCLPRRSARPLATPARRLAAACERRIAVEDRSMERGASEAGNSLPITRWSLIARAGQSAESAQRVALTELLTRYLPAMRAHLSARGRFRADEVDDLLQGFVANKVLEQNLVAAADRNRGRFRTFLLTSLDNYVANVVRERGAAKRSPPGGRPPESLNERGDVAAPPPGPDPFDVVWAQQVFREAMARMRFECEVAGRSDLWSLFDARVAAPLLHGHDVVPYDQLVARLGFASPSQATNALATAKRTFQRMLRSVVGEYADGEADIDRELADLRRVLERSV